MLFQIGSIKIAHDTDGVTAAVGVELPQYSKEVESIGVIGLPHPHNIGDESSPCELTVTVGRQFKDYAAAERFEYEHAEFLRGVGRGECVCITMLGNVFSYKDAMIESAEHSRDDSKGVYVKTTYNVAAEGRGR